MHTVLEVGIDLKVCTTCKVAKPLSAFSKRDKHSGELQGKCKACFSEYNRLRYQGERGRRHRAKVYEYRRLFPERVMLTRVVTCKANPSNKRAYRAVEAAIACGALVRPTRCSACGREVGDGFKRIEAHHYDYSRPLVVEWLCTPCHRVADGVTGRRRRDTNIPTSAH